MSKFELKTPVLFMVFNRLEPTKKVFEEIKKARPRKLFIASDGPRNSEEKVKVDLVRKFILDSVDWECDVKTLFRKKNLGCKNACVGAIDWFFENVEMGIILEDDCLPDLSFFRYCEEMLAKYKDNNRVMHIAGSNPLGSYDSEYSYLFSTGMFIWGWATWERAWNKYDVDIKEYGKLTKNEIKEYWPNLIQRASEIRRIDDLINKKIDTWDAQWIVCLRLNKGLCITPRDNLIENIGFTSGATHTHENSWDIKYLAQKRKEMEFPLIHPKKVEQNNSFDRKVVFRDIKRVLLKKLFNLN